MPIAMAVADAFTGRAFAGNPAAVCVLRADDVADERWMQKLAAEMALSETAFVQPLPNGEGWGLRWFTPAAEVALCGHATLASAHVLWSEHGVRDEVLRFHTKSGVLTATRAGTGTGTGTGTAISLDFPAKSVVPAAASAALAAALGIEPAAVAAWGACGQDALVELRSEAALRALAPDFAALRAVDVRAVIVTARPDDGGAYDFVSRFFAPRIGVDEDPVTGSAHCALGPYWAARLGKQALRGYQASPRGGTVEVAVSGDGRVALTGRAVLVWKGELADAAGPGRGRDV